MIIVNVKGTVRKSTDAEITTTPREFFDNLGVDVSTSMVSLSGAHLTAEDFGKTFETLGVADGSTVTMNVVVKADGANR